MVQNLPVAENKNINDCFSRDVLPAINRNEILIDIQASKWLSIKYIHDFSMD